jgi:hypothetical protein
VALTISDMDMLQTPMGVNGRTSYHDVFHSVVWGLLSLNPLSYFVTLFSLLD